MFGGVKKFFAEFRDFAFKGNMIDLAVAVVIGKAVGDLITSVVKNLVMPLVSMLVQHGQQMTDKAGVPIDYTHWHLGQVQIGAFLGDLLNFILITLAVFISIVKLIQVVTKFSARKKVAEVVAPTTKECPKCLSVIPIKAIKCAHCTSDLEPLPA